MDEKTMIRQLTQADTVQAVVDIMRSAGRSLSYEQADRLFGRINQTKCDAAELSGDTPDKVVARFLAA